MPKRWTGQKEGDRVLEQLKAWQDNQRWKANIRKRVLGATPARIRYWHAAERFTGDWAYWIYRREAKQSSIWYYEWDLFFRTIDAEKE